VGGEAWTATEGSSGITVGLDESESFKQKRRQESDTQLRIDLPPKEADTYQLSQPVKCHILQVCLFRVQFGFDLADLLKFAH